MYKGLGSLVAQLRGGGKVNFTDYAPYFYRLDELLHLAPADVELLREYWAQQRTVVG